MKVLRLIFLIPSFSIFFLLLAQEIPSAHSEDTSQDAKISPMQVSAGGAGGGSCVNPIFS